VKATLNVGNRWTLSTMDGLGRTIKVEQGDSSGVTKSVVDTEYDSCACSPLGKVKRVSQPYAPGGTVYYDGLGRTLSVSLPGGTGTTTYVYQGNATTVTDPAGKWKKFTTDAMGNLTKVTEPNPAGGADLDSNYTYDMFSHLKQVSMTRGSTTQTRTFVYDTNTQRLQSVTHPESGQTSYTYNNDDTVATKIDAKNQKVAYTYDSYKRLTKIQRYPVSTGAEDVCQQVTFTYDTSTYGQNLWGRLATVTWGDGICGRSFTEAYSYSVGGLVLKKNLSSAWEAVYTYDTEGKMTSVTYPGDTNGSGAGRKYTYTFDSMGRPNKLTDDQPTPVDWAKNVTYGPAGELTQMDYFKATGQYYTETRSYNPRLQVSQIRAYYGATDSLNMQYIYSGAQNNGQITQSIDAVSGETVNYTYDSVNRLITAATTGTQWGLSFTYDGFGNRTAQTVTKGSAPSSSVAISASTNRITTTGYGYDSNGNMTTMPYGSGSMTLSYDVDNRMKQAVNTNGTEKYAYNAENRRVYEKRPDGTELVYFYGVNGDRLRVYQLTQTGFQVQHTNIYFAGRLIRQDNTTAFVDRLGSVRTNSRYYPYGEEQTTTANDTDKFATYYRDSSTGLDYAINRYYGSNMGRFLSPDPFGGSAKPENPQSWNRYAYVTNDPVNQSDPNGLDPAEYWGPPDNWFGSMARFGMLLFTYNFNFMPNIGGPSPSELWNTLKKRLGGARDTLNSKEYSEDCNRTLGKLSGATTANNQKAGTIDISTVLAQVNTSFGSISDGSDTPYWTVFPEGSRDRSQTRNSRGTRDWTVADAMGFNNMPAMAQIGGNGVYFSEKLNRTRSADELAATLLHEATHNLGFSEGKLTELGVTSNDILRDCVKK
jgi:RHS repeat-associated protein